MPFIELSKGFFLLILRIQHSLLIWSKQGFCASIDAQIAIFWQGDRRVKRMESDFLPCCLQARHLKIWTNLGCLRVESRRMSNFHRLLDDCVSSTHSHTYNGIDAVGSEFGLTPGIDAINDNGYCYDYGWYGMWIDDVRCIEGMHVRGMSQPGHMWRW